MPQMPFHFFKPATSPYFASQMKRNCAASCDSCGWEGDESCKSRASSVPVVHAGDISRIFERARAMEWLKPKVWSSDPWVMTFDDFVSEAEAQTPSPLWKRARTIDASLEFLPALSPPRHCALRIRDGQACARFLGLTACADERQGRDSELEACGCVLCARVNSDDARGGCSQQSGDQRQATLTDLKRRFVNGAQAFIDTCHDGFQRSLAGDVVSPVRTSDQVRAAACMHMHAYICMHAHACMHVRMHACMAPGQICAAPCMHTWRSKHAFWRKSLLKPNLVRSVETPK
eukprot:1426640-Pleurochrysis_carterae.AAC.3